MLRGNALTNFLMSKTGLKWDAETISNIGVDDLDQESFGIFRREALRSGRMTKEDLDIANVELLEKMDLVVGEDIVVCDKGRKWLSILPQDDWYWMIYI